MDNIYIGKKVEISYVNCMSKEEQIKLRKLNFIVTVDDLDIINNQVMGFYSVEFDGYLFTIDQIRS